MEKCDHFKDLILTDYIDGELDKGQAGGLESHLLICPDCRAFLKEVKKNASLPFQHALRQPVPSELWDSVRQSIEHETRVTSPLEDFIERIKGLIVFPRLVPVFASLILMLLAGSVALNTIQTHRSQEKDQGEYLVSLLSATGGLSTPENNDPGTPIEHYFL